MTLRLLSEIPEQRQKRYPGHARLVGWTDNKSARYSPTEFAQQVNGHVAGLMAAGVGKGDYIFFHIAGTSINLLACEFAVLKLGAIVCPVDAGMPDEVFQQFFTTLSPRYVIVENRDHGQPRLQNMTLLSADELFIPGSAAVEVGVEIHPFDEAVIIFTSGTTGSSKGVILTHQNLVTTLQAIVRVMPITHHHTTLSFLPISHVFERVVLYSYLLCGANVHIARSPQDARRLFRKVNPHYFTAVPRILEGVFKAFRIAVERKGFFHAQLLQWALRQSLHGGRPAKWFARIFVLRRLRRIFGSNLIGVIAGGAAMDADVLQWYTTSGMKVREGYGLSETSGVVAVNRLSQGDYCPGTVGPLLPGVEIKFDNMEHGAGEILVKSPGVMKGYLYPSTEDTRVFTEDGWFRTGDTGYLVDNRFLKISGRAKDIFKNSYGEYVVPGAIEAALQASRSVDQVIVVGLARPHSAAIIVPDFAYMELWCNQQGIHWTAPLYMSHHPEVISHFQAIVDDVNVSLSPHEQVRSFRLVPDTWTVENGLLTPSYKLRRTHIEQYFQKEIKDLYKNA